MTESGRSFESWLPQSHRHWEAARRVIPEGASRSRFWRPHFVYADRAEGPYVWDIDGNRYVDCMLGAGPLILGHRNPQVIGAIEDQLSRGLMFGAPVVAEAELAARIVANVPNAEWVVFVGSGTEATLGALRISRAATGRNKLAKFEGGFHGWHDFVINSCYAGAEGDIERPTAVPESRGISTHTLDEVIVLPFNHPAALERIRNEAEDIACVMIEPLQGAAGCFVADDDFLRDLRKVCSEKGILLVFDEVISGFRLSPSGAAGHFGVQPDLTTLGKVIGGGLPIGAICGSESLREVLVDPDRKHKSIVLAGTFAANAMSMTAGRAQLDVLLADPALYERLGGLGQRMRDGLTSVFQDLKMSAYAPGLGSVWGLQFTHGSIRSRRDSGPSNHDLAGTLHGLLLREGVLMTSPVHLGFVSTTHSESDVDYVVDAHARALAEIKAMGVFEEWFDSPSGAVKVS